MKQIIFCVAISLLLGNEVSFGQDAEMVYIDGGFAGYCFSHEVRNAAVECVLYDITSGKIRRRLLPGTIFPAAMNALSYEAKFPLAWSLSNKKLRILFPNLYLDPRGKISFVVWPDNGTSVSADETKELDAFQPTSYTVTNGVATYSDWHARGFHFPLLSSCTFALSLGRLSLRKGQIPEMIWYALDNTNIIARLPFISAESHSWGPCASPLFTRWTEFQWFPILEQFFRDDLLESIQNATIIHSQDIPSDGFSPVGSVRISNKRVLCDDPKAIFPKEADWLIWEKNGDNCRLCQMRGGRWSVCQDMTRKDAPRTIVVNNDSNTVFLLYSIGMDAKDVDSSLKKIVAFLRARGALSPRRKVNNEDVVAELDTGALRLNVSAVDASIVKHPADANSGKDSKPETHEPPPRKPTLEETAKHGAELYERPETREKGLAILRKAANAGSPFALARLSALYYLGEGGVRQDYGMALRLMKSASSKGFPSFLLPIKDAEAALQREKAAKGKSKPTIRPGGGYPGRLGAYAVTPELKRQLDRFNLTAGWFHRGKWGQAPFRVMIFA